MEYIEEPIPAHREHLQILAALEARQPERSEQLMTAHIRRVALFVANRAKALRGMTKDENNA